MLTLRSLQPVVRWIQTRKCTDANVTSASIRQNIRNILSNTSKANTWALDIIVTNVNINLLRKHLNSIHNGIKYCCDQCDFLTTTQTSPKIHKGIRHKGIIYSCDTRDYSGITNSRLKRHQITKHNGTTSVSNVTIRQTERNVLSST